MTTAIGRPTTRSSSGVERYTLRIAVTDALVITWAVIGAQLVRFGTSAGDVEGPQTSTFGLASTSSATRRPVPLNAPGWPQ